MSTSFPPAASPPGGVRVLTRELPRHIGKTVVVRGWLHHTRDMGGKTFVLVRDRSGVVQAVASSAELAPLRATHRGSVVEVRGTVAADPRAASGVEIHHPTFVVRAHSKPPVLDLHAPQLTAQLPFLLDHAPVSLRHPSRQAVARLVAALAAGFRHTLDAEGFTEIFTPKILGTATEGGANVFGVDYFGQPAFLAQSPQLYKQMMVGALERVYEVGPVFRAEPHDTARHLAQYTSLDAEMGFIDELGDVMALLSRVMAGMMAQAAALSDPPPGLTVPKVPDTIPTVHFVDALQRLSDAFGLDLSREPDLEPAHERWLGAWAARDLNSDFLFVVGYPLHHRPFYTHPDPARPGYSASFDLLFRGLEVVTGGQRIHLADDLRRALAERRIDPAAFQGYLEAFDAGMPAHGGFAIGLERVAQQLTGAQNLREVTLFPRDVRRLAP
jgi:nondiscriminating aspartyl-tRNA synthetase